MATVPGSNTDEDDESLDPVLVETTPAYNVEPYKGGGTGTQCSYHQEFCFFCEYPETLESRQVREDDDEDDDDPSIDMVGALKNMINIFTAEGAELVVIVNRLYDRYQTFRDEVVWKNPHTGVVIPRPDWSKEAITRHLT